MHMSKLPVCCIKEKRRKKCSLLLRAGRANSDSPWTYLSGQVLSGFSLYPAGGFLLVLFSVWSKESSLGPYLLHKLLGDDLSLAIVQDDGRDVDGDED